MSAIRIRTPEPADATAIARLSADLGYPATPAEIHDRLALLTGDASQCLRVAVGPEGTVVGWAHAAHQVLLESGARCELLGLVTAPGNRRRGVGRALVESVETWARAGGLPLVSVRCNVVRTDAHGFYEHLGYRQAKTQHAFRKPLTAEAEIRPMA